MKENTTTIIAIILVIGGALSLSFLLTSGIYYLFTLIMSTFFSVMIPFTWHYALGVWLILILINVLFGGVKLSVKN